MMLCEYFYCIIMIFVALHFKTSASLSNKDIGIVKTGVETLSPCSVGMVLYAVVNNTSSDKIFDVELTPDQCCLNTDGKDVCNVMRIEGNCVDEINKGTTKVLRLVAPLIEPFERRGYCIVYLDSKPKARQRKAMRDKIKILFDTRLRNLKQPKELVANLTICSEVDQDPLNDCKPVDCVSFYNGKRSFFDNKTKRCVAIPLCVSGANSEFPDIIYDKNKNKCVFGEAIAKDDINLIKKLTVNEKNRHTKDIIILKNHITYKPDLMLNETKDMISKIDSDKNYELKLDSDKLKGYKYTIKKYFCENRWTLSVLIGVILVQCCLICSMIYCLTSNCGKCAKKTVVKKFFNYRQDASVTTPLICTSNIDTDTTEFQYFNESSNIDNMIKCYKACQKERKTQGKLCMSDDILSKCVTRRDWKSKPVRSVAVTESKQTEGNKDDSDIEPSSINNGDRKHSSVRVNFENEQDKPRQKKENKDREKTVKRSKRDKKYDEMQIGLSERELKCHSYNYVQNESNLTGFEPSSHKKIGYIDAAKKNHPISISTEKGAQAEFSNDSLDDFLSERGMVFKAGEDLSKYSFSSNTNELKSSLASEISSRTSKNNVVNYVKSILHRKASHGPSSYPGAKKKDTNTNVELIHMSKASVYSSYNGSEYLRNLKQTKDSKTSL